MKRIRLFYIVSSVLLVGCVNNSANNSTESTKAQAQNSNKVEICQQNCPIIAIEDKSLVDIKESTYFINEYTRAYHFNFFIGLNLSEYSYEDRYYRLSLALSKIFEEDRFLELKDDPFFRDILEMKSDKKETVNAIINATIKVPYLSKIKRTNGAYSYQYANCDYSADSELIGKISKLGAKNLQFIIKAVMILKQEDENSNDIIIKANTV